MILLRMHGSEASWAELCSNQFLSIPCKPDLQDAACEPLTCLWTGAHNTDTLCTSLGFLPLSGRLSSTMPLCPKPHRQHRSVTSCIVMQVRGMSVFFSGMRLAGIICADRMAEARLRHVNQA